MTTARQTRRARRYWRALGLLLLGLLALIGALPWLVGLPPVREQIVAAANRALAPARLDVDGLGVSWFAPTEVSGVVLKDAQGTVLARVAKATFDRGLASLATDPRPFGTLTITGAELAVERRADGSIDLLDALRPKPSPAGPANAQAAPAPRAWPDVTLVVTRSKLTLRSPELPEPLVIEPLELQAHVPGATGPATWKGVFETPHAPAGTKLAVEGLIDLRTAGDLVVNLESTHWPLAVGVSGVAARGTLEGKVEVRQQAGRWGSTGDLRVLGLDASGAALAGDRLKLDRVEGRWDVGQAGQAWTIKRLDVTSPVATIEATGALEAPGSATRITGKIDLAALAKQVPHALRLRDGITLESGMARLQADIQTLADGQRFDLAAALSDLAAREDARPIVLRDPATLSAQVRRKGDEVHVETLAVKTPFLDASGKGNLTQGVLFTATLDLDGLRRELHDLLDFGALTLSGRGRLVADYRKTGPSFAGRLAVEVRSLKVAGLTDAPIQRELAHFDGNLNGPIADSGLPAGWDRVRFALKASPTIADVNATQADGTATFQASLAAPLPIAGRDARATAQLAGRRKGSVIDLDSARLAVAVADAPPGPVGAELTARGRLDLAAGVLDLQPIAGVAPGALAIGPEGIKVTGLGSKGPGLRVEGGLAGDAGALDLLVASLQGGESHGLMGPYSAKVLVEPSGPAGRRVVLKAEAPGLSRPDAAKPGARLPEPVALALAVSLTGDRLDFESLALATRYAALLASGHVEDPAGKRLADLQGSLRPNWTGLSALADVALEPGATLKGAPERAFRIKGALSGASAAEILKGLDAEVGFDQLEVEAFGVKVAPTALVVRCGGGRTVLDPIRTVVNDGEMDLKAEVVLDDPRGLALRVLPGAYINGAQINDDVTEKVLTFIAPPLHNATKVTGRLAVNLNACELPLGGDATRTAAVDGQLVFNNVVFAPGANAEQVLGLAGAARKPSLRLHEAVQFKVADRRVIQHGLTIPVGKDATVAIDGSVGFDETLALKAQVPIPTSLLGKAGAAEEFVQGTRLTVPIGGTVARPTVDREALKVGLKDVSESFLKRGGKDLLKGLVPGASPDANPGPAAPADGADVEKGAQKIEGLLRGFLPK